MSHWEAENILPTTAGAAAAAGGCRYSQRAPGCVGTAQPGVGTPEQRRTAAAGEGSIQGSASAAPAVSIPGWESAAGEDRRTPSPSGMEVFHPAAGTLGSASGTGQMAAAAGLTRRADGSRSPRAGWKGDNHSYSGGLGRKLA